MKSKKALFTAVVCLTAATMMSGCNITDFGIDSLLRPPKTMGDEAEIEQLIADTAQKGYTLKYPKSGSYRSAIIMKDLDGDNSEEALAFYRENDDVARLHMLVMYNSGSEWKLASDSVTETTDVDRVDFADVSGSGTLEIAVGYSTYNQNTNMLSCYSYLDGEISEINAGQSYYEFYCGDFNLDGKDELMALSLYSSDNEASASMLEYDPEKNIMYPKVSVAMDPNVIKYKNVSVAPVGGDAQGVFVDGELATGEIITQIVYYNFELSILRNPLYKEKSENVTKRSSNVVCADVDGDGVFDFPTVEKLPHSDKEPAETVADKITWNTLSADNESITQKLNMAVNYNLAFTVKMPDSWHKDTVTVINSVKENTMTFYEWNKSSVGEKLFEIKVFNISDWENGKGTDDYTIIYKDSTIAYAFVNYNADSKYSLSDDEIKKSFALLTETAL